ncbi:MAG: long-chain acyl-CoA synthetase, partial [Myxococcota bacterium]
MAHPNPNLASQAALRRVMRARCDGENTMKHTTIGSMILSRIKANPSGPALRLKRGSSWVDLSWAHVGKRMASIASGLLTIEGGLEDRAAITIMGNTSEDWITTDFAGLSIGLRTVPVYATLLPEEAGYLHSDTEAVVAVVENALQLEKVRSLRTGFNFFDR